MQASSCALAWCANRSPVPTEYLPSVYLDLSIIDIRPHHRSQPGAREHRSASPLQTISFFDEPVGQVMRNFEGFALFQPVLRDQARKEAAIDAARHIMPRRDG
jgi:hypothetical protein